MDKDNQYRSLRKETAIVEVISPPADRGADGKFIEGNPGRPPGAKNKFTYVKEALVEAFEEVGGKEAFMNTLIIEGPADAAGNKTKYINIKALNAVLRVLPRDLNITGEINHTHALAKKLEVLTTDELRAIARGEVSLPTGSAEDTSAA